MSNYPYTKRELLQEFRHQPGHKGYQIKKVNAIYPIFKEMLQESEEWGYDFLFSSRWQLWNKISQQKETSLKKIRLSFYMCMECDSCQMSNSLGQKVKRRWTTDIGKIQISYTLVPLEKIAKIDKNIKKVFTPAHYPYMLLFNYYVYRMKCSLCNHWGKIYFYPNILEAIGRELCRRVVFELDGVEEQQNEKKNHGGRILKGHKKELCQACQKGVCMKKVENQ